METLSIIIPVYKVEDCLERCLDSIMAQTFIDYECILVDDGSPDRCGNICDEYAKRDKRFVVIHQENSGLSTARNNALKIAKGKYVAFVDSDDWLEPEMYEKMIGLMGTYQAQIAMCDYHSLRNNNMNMQGTGTHTYSGREFTEKVLKDEIGSQLWKFVYERSLWNGIESPYRRHAQDMMILHIVTNRARCIVTTEERLYIYNDTRQTNISNDPKNVVKNKIDRALAFFQRMDFSFHENYSEEVMRSVINQAVFFSINAFFDATVLEPRFVDDVGSIRMYYRKYFKEISKYSKRGDYILRAIIITISPKVYVRIYSAFSKKRHKDHVR